MWGEGEGERLWEVTVGWTQARVPLGTKFIICYDGTLILQRNRNITTLAHLYCTIVPSVLELGTRGTPIK